MLLFRFVEPINIYFYIYFTILIESGGQYFRIRLNYYACNIELKKIIVRLKISFVIKHRFVVTKILF